MSLREYPLHIVHGYRFDPADVARFLRDIEQAKPETLADMHGVSKGRRPLLSYGAVILQEIIRLGEASAIEISAVGVREGYVFERLDAASRNSDPLLSAAQELNVLRSRSRAHGEELRRWTDAFMETTGLMEDDNDRRLRHAACLLADVGWRAHPDYRGEQSFNLIAHAALCRARPSGEGISRARSAVPVQWAHLRRRERSRARPRRAATIRACPAARRNAPRRISDQRLDCRRSSADPASPVVRAPRPRAAKG